MSDLMLPIEHVEAPYIRDVLKELSSLDDIIVVGAYKGSTCQFIRHFHPHVRLTAFEPQEWAYKQLVEHCKEEPTPTGFLAYNVALGLEDNDNVPLYEYGTDAASFLVLPGSRTLGNCRSVDAARFLREHNLTCIALAIVNIEGYEYALIPYLLANEDINLQRILVQCHHKETYRTAYGKTHESLNDKSYTMLDIGAGWELWTQIAPA